MKIADQKKRLKLMRALRGDGHRYRMLRTLGLTVSLGILFVVPLSGLARVDLWRGNHALLFQPASFKHGLAGVILGIAAMYVVTFLSNVAAGRLFCGWGCPVGQISRFGESIDVPKISRATLWSRRLGGAAFSAAFVLSWFVWWCDPRILWTSERSALLAGWSALTILTALCYLQGRYWRWDFCKSACPIGLYYSFVSPAHWFGIHFRNEDKSCIECNACDNVCPVHLKPRELSVPVPARSGLSISGAPGRNHCLECGDCVRACEWMVARAGGSSAPLHLGYFSGPQGCAATSRQEQEA